MKFNIGHPPRIKHLHQEANDVDEIVTNTLELLILKKNTYQIRRTNTLLIDGRGVDLIGFVSQVDALTYLRKYKCRTRGSELGSVDWSSPRIDWIRTQFAKDRNISKQHFNTYLPYFAKDPLNSVHMI